MHPPFRPRLAARSNPKNGLFSGNPQELRALSADIDSDSSLISRRRTLAQMLMQRGEDKQGAYAEVDNTLYAAWLQAKPADRLKALRSATRRMKNGLEGDTGQDSLTGFTAEGDAIESDVAAGTLEEVEEDATRGLTAPVRAAMLASYSLTPQLFDDLRRSRKEDSVLAQEYGRSTKDITTLRAAASMLALHISREALMAADDLDDLIDALS